jgi:hypothetical protein
MSSVPQWIGRPSRSEDGRQSLSQDLAATANADNHGIVALRRTIGDFLGQAQETLFDLLGVEDDLHIGCPV